MPVATADQDSNEERKRDSERDTGSRRTEEEEKQGSRPGRVDGSRSADGTRSAGRLAEPRRARAALADVEARSSRHRSRAACQTWFTAEQEKDALNIYKEKTAIIL